MTIETTDRPTQFDRLQEKIKVLHDSIWEGRAEWPQVLAWLGQFDNEKPTEDDRLQALYILSNFMYFGTSEIRALLRSLYRDVFRASVIAELRNSNPTLQINDAQAAFQRELRNTRFVPLGNPSESSAFLLYYFRQENSLPRDCFISGAEIFSRDEAGKISLREPSVTRYVFIDDMCGSGKQGEEYSRNTVLPLKSENAAAKAYYYALFGTSAGIESLRSLARFDQVHPVVELDETFRCFCDSSRIYKNADPPISMSAGKALAERHGRQLMPSHPLGYMDGQLLLGFAYNTPDNSLPIVWASGNERFPWTPVFRRYSKLSYS